MSNKEVVSKIGIVIIFFLLFLVALGSQQISWAQVVNTVPLASANAASLEALWTTLVAATLFQAFVIFAALLGANLQFTPSEDKHYLIDHDGGDH